MDKYEFYYFSEKNVSDIPDRIVPLDCQDDNAAFIQYDRAQEYLNGIRSPENVLLVKNGKPMSNEFLAWVGGDDYYYPIESHYKEWR